VAFTGGQPVKKNVEFLLIIPIYDNDGDLVTGAADLDSKVSKNGGAFIDCTNEAVEIGSSGVYKLTLTATEMNADVVAVITKTSTGDAKTTLTVIYTSAYQVEAMRGTDNAATETKQDIIDTVVDAIKVKTDTLGGAGAIIWIYTLTDADTGNPIADADVWITSDLAGTNIIASGKTNQEGKVTFYLDAGTVYVWRQKSGWDFDNPDVEVIS